MTVDDLLTELRALYPKRFNDNGMTAARAYIAALKRHEGDTLATAWTQAQESGLDLRWPPSPSEMVKACQQFAPAERHKTRGDVMVDAQRWGHELCRRHAATHRDCLRELFVWGTNNVGDSPSPAQLERCMQDAISHVRDRANALSRFPADSLTGETLRNITRGMDAFEQVLREKHA